MQVFRMQFPLILLAACGLIGADAARAADAPRNGWHTDFAAASRESKQHGKVLVLHFYADWCGPCRTMEHQVLGTGEVRAQLGTQVVGVKINSDRSPDLVARYNVTALPSDVYLSPEGRVLSRTTGSSGLSGYVANLKRLGSKYNRAAEDAVVVAGAETAGSDKSAPAASTPTIGLDGFSPVAITTEKKWTKGAAEFAVTYEGVIYHLASADEKVQFEESPEKYVPALRGCDPLIFSTRGRAVPGVIRYGSFYKGRFYMHYSELNRRLFLKTPGRYVDESLVVDLREIEPEQIIR